MQKRGLDNETIEAAGLGWNPTDLWRDPLTWGFDGGKRIWLPKGIVIPWETDESLWRVNIRRSNGKPRYYSARGWRNVLYNADALNPDDPAILVEGEFDALYTAWFDDAPPPIEVWPGVPYRPLQLQVPVTP